MNSNSSSKSLAQDSTAKSQDVFRRQIEQLRQAGRLEEAERLEHAQAEFQRARAAQERSEAQAGKVDAPANLGPRISSGDLNHLREAAENLSAAGLQEQAEQLRRQAEMMRSKVGDIRDLPPELQRTALR